MKLNPVAVAPIREERSAAFVDREDGTGKFCMAALPVYPASENGKRMRELRIEAGLGLRETAKLFGIGALQIFELERGAKTLPDEEWRVVLGLLSRARYSDEANDALDQLIVQLREKGRVQ